MKRSSQRLLVAVRSFKWTRKKQSMRKRRVLVLGAAQHQICSLQAIQDMGCEVVAIDRNMNAPGFQVADFYEVVDIVDVDKALKVAERYRTDAVIPLTDFGVQTAAAIAYTLDQIGISPHIARDVTSKAQMRRAWKRAKVPSVRFRVVRNLGETYRTIEELGTWPLVFKPADSRGGGSRGVSRVDSLNGVPQALEFAQSFYEDKSVVIEEFLEGIEHSLEMVVFEGQMHVLAISDKEKTPYPFRVDKSVIYPTIFTGKELKSIINVARQAVQAIGINVGAVHVEMCTTEGGPKMFELGARFGGGHTPDPIVRYVTGINVVKEVTRILLGEKPLSMSPKTAKGCIYRFLTPMPGKLRSVSGLEEIQRWEGILDCGLWVRPGEYVHPVRTGGDRAGYIVAGAADRASALNLADRAEAALKFEYQ